MLAHKLVTAELCVEQLDNQDASVEITNSSVKLLAQLLDEKLLKQSSASDLQHELKSLDKKHQLLNNLLELLRVEPSDEKTEKKATLTKTLDKPGRKSARLQSAQTAKTTEAAQTVMSTPLQVQHDTVSATLTCLKFLLVNAKLSLNAEQSRRVASSVLSLPVNNKARADFLAWTQSFASNGISFAPTARSPLALYVICLLFVFLCSSFDLNFGVFRCCHPGWKFSLCFVMHKPKPWTQRLYSALLRF